MDLQCPGSNGFRVACGECCVLFQLCLPDNVKMAQEKAASYVLCVPFYSRL